MGEASAAELAPLSAQTGKIEVSQNPEVRSGQRKSEMIRILYAVIFYPILYCIAVYFLGDISYCSSASASVFVLHTCDEIGHFLFDTIFWLLPLFVAVVAYGCSYIFVNIKVWNDKFYQITTKKRIWTTISAILSVIIYLVSTFALTFIVISYSNEAKTKLVPVVAYANAHGWKSVADAPGGPGIDTPTPGYYVAFLTTQTAHEAEQTIKMILEEEGYNVDVTLDTYRVGDIDINALMPNGNHIFSEISNTEYDNNDVYKVPAGMTAVELEVTDYGYAK